MNRNLDIVVMDASHTLFKKAVSLIATEFLFKQRLLTFSDILKLCVAAFYFIIGKYTKSNFALRAGAHISSQIFEKYHYVLNDEKYVAMLFSNIDWSKLRRLLKSKIPVVATVEYKGLLIPFAEFLKRYGYGILIIGSRKDGYLIGLEEKIILGKAIYSTLLKKYEEKVEIRIKLIDDMLRNEVQILY